VRFREDSPRELARARSAGETVVNRYRLCELLDKLDELTGGHPGRAVP
jgi:hypothetical protein